MKRVIMPVTALLLLALSPAILHAQDEKDKAKDKDKKKDVEQIIITNKSGSDEKIVVEIIGDKVTVNGKPVEDLKDGDISVRRNKFKTFEGLNYFTPGQNNFNFNWDHDGEGFFTEIDENRALLGVVTEKDDKGAKVSEVTKESAAEKSGVKKGDIITKINDTKITDPDVLSETIRKHKPGDKVSVTLLRDGKEQKLDAELGKWKGASVLSFSPKISELMSDQVRPRIQSIPRTPYAWSYPGSGPRLGLSVQDTEDGVGVKVIEADEDGNAAKAGIKEGDIITKFNDKDVKGADEIAKLVKENKDKASIKLQIKRAGKIQTIEVKMPKKLKTADL